MSFAIYCNCLRKCRRCHHYKPESCFSDNKRSRAKENRCKSCIKTAEKIRRNLKKNAPPKPDCCQCCKKKVKTLCLDHCHDTYEFRGWICGPCNRGIGQLGDNIEGLEQALRYLKYKK